MSEFLVRKATPGDAAAIAGVLDTVASERVHSAIDRAWSVEEQACHLQALSPREAIHLVSNIAAGVVGLQILDRWAPSLPSMAHVGQLGTYLLPAWRGRGLGQLLWGVTREFALQAGYRKLAIQVRGSNAAAQSYYRRLGFQPCGRFSRQVVIDGIEDDEILMELFL